MHRGILPTAVTNTRLRLELDYRLPASTECAVQPIGLEEFTVDDSGIDLSRSNEFAVCLSLN